MSHAPQLPAADRWWRLYAIAALTFLPALGFYYVGEEAIFPISSLEMWFHGQWVEQLLYGGSLKHNPLFNWLIIPLAAATGWEHMLGVTRAITIAATVGTGLTLAWLANELYRDATFAAFAALVYLTLADVFFYRGWLAYVDPLFAFFVFASIALLWTACRRRSAALLALAVVAATGAFMSKAFTAYVFYAAAALVLMTDRGHRSFLLAPASWLVHALAAAWPAVWLHALPANTGQGGRMFAEVLTKLAPEGLTEFALKLVIYPLDTAARLAPALFIAGYYGWRRRAAISNTFDPDSRIALWILFINYLPYWLAPQSSIRYLLPLYPLAGLVMARTLWGAGAPAVAATRRWLIAVIAVKLAVVLAVFPYYQKQYRGENFETTARDILRRTAGQPLYANNVSASGLSVTAHLDVLRLPAPPLTFPPGQWEAGFVMAYAPDPRVGRVAAEYRLGGNTLYLLCRGPACGKAAQ